MSRYIDGFQALDEVNLLLKYLYLRDEGQIENEDDFTVEFENSMGIRFSLRMNDDYSLTRVMLNGIIPGQVIDCHDMTHTQLMAVVDQLKEAPAKQFPNEFASRWDEVKSIAAMHIGYNEYLSDRRGCRPKNENKEM